MTQTRKLLYGAAIVFVAGVVLNFTGLGGDPAPEVATCDDPSPTIIPAEWAAENLGEGPYFQTLFSPDAKERILNADPMPVPSFTTNGRSQLEHVTAGRIYIDRRGPIQALDDVNWAEEDHGGYYSTQLHGLVSVGGLFELDERLPEQVSDAVGDYIENWALCSAHNRDINSRAWFEGTVIKRQSNLLSALNYMRQWGELGDLSYEELIYLIDANAEFLLDTEDVYAHENHGVRQDMLLAATALALPSHPRASEMIETAERRLDETAVKLFTAEGVWMEHAPGYVHYALRLMNDVKRLNTASESFNPSLFLSRFDSSLSYLLSSLLPSGQIPYIGMSGASRIMRDISSNDDVERFLALKSRSLSVFDDYGHAIVRGDHPDGLYLLFVAAQNLPAGKRHADDLSFLLYNFGRPWISEGGHQTYELTGMTRYLRSPLAHNTYTLDGDYLRENENPGLATELVEAHGDAATVVVTGRTERFPKPATFERRIEIKDYSTIHIKDALTGDGQWEGRFQIPGDLKVTIEEDTVTATDPEGKRMVLSFAADVPLSFSTCHGQEKPICGWANAAHEFGPATTVMWSFQGAAEVDINIAWQAR